MFSICPLLWNSKLQNKIIEFKRVSTGQARDVRKQVINLMHKHLKYKLQYLTAFILYFFIKTASDAGK